MVNISSPSIVIVGSLNMDFVVQVNQLPTRGATIPGKNFQTMPGGKGANQAFAVGKLGGRGAMIGCVGADVFGAQLQANLQSVGINTDHVQTIADTSTGVALIEVEQSGQNTIVVVAGANEKLTPTFVQTALANYQAGLLLLQLESPMETVEAAAAQAKANAMTVILDPAPAQNVSAALLRNVDILTPNESEALALLERSGNEISLADAPQIAQAILALGAPRVILKMGEKGAFFADANRQQHFPARQVKAVDTTAAGDCFNGALAVALAGGKTMDEAIIFANCAAAIAVTHLGAQASIPNREEVEFTRNAK